MLQDCLQSGHSELEASVVRSALGEFVLEAIDFESVGLVLFDPLESNEIVDVCTAFQSSETGSKVVRRLVVGHVSDGRGRGGGRRVRGGGELRRWE